ncbi:MAG: DUF177 domain-containing protein [Rikenellaceae bacterium]|nr:DUF177 domain-containing protein [Rikenellaceae bacterium]
MKKNREYVVNINGLALGQHEYLFHVDRGLFQLFENSEVSDGSAEVNLILEKKSNMLELGFSIGGEVQVECDRCLEQFMIPVDYKGTLLVKYSEKEKESDGDVIWIAHNEHELDLSQYIYESILLSLPYQRVHPEDENGVPECDPEMLGRFTIISGEEFDEMYPETEEEGNSTWKNALESLKDKINEENSNDK